MLDKWILRCAAGLAVAALCGAPPAEAGQRAPDSIADLAAAPRIVVAEVESAESRWNAQGTLIVTDYRLRRIETLRGEFADQFVLTQGGGRVGDDGFLAVEHDLAFVWLQQAEEDVHQRRLAGAVLADDGVDLAAPDGKIDVFIGDEGAETLGDADQFDGSFGSCCLIFRPGWRRVRHDCLAA